MSPTVTAPRRPAADRPRTHTRRTGGSPPRRVSGPVGGRLATVRAQRLRPRPASREPLALGGRALALVRSLPDNSLVDRLVRGRAWIPLLGVLLVGIVAMQVEILKLGASMGRAMERSSTLQTQNESLQASVASLADDQRIERLAAGMGMVMPTPGSLVFLTVRPGGAAGRAVGNIHPPDPTGFLSQLAAQAAAAAALAPAPPSNVPASSTAAGPSLGAGPSTTAPSSPPATTSPATGAASTTGSGTASGVATAPAAPSGSSTASPAAGTQSAASSGTGAPTGSGAGTPTGAAGVAPTGTPQSSASGGG